MTEIKLPPKPAELVAAEAELATAQAHGREAMDHLANLRHRASFAHVGFDALGEAEAAAEATRAPADAASRRVVELRRQHAVQAAEAAKPAIAAACAEVKRHAAAIAEIADTFAESDRKARGYGFALAGLPSAGTLSSLARQVERAVGGR